MAGWDQLACGPCRRYHGAGAPAQEGSSSLWITQAFAIARSHYMDSIDLETMSLGVTLGYEASELDEKETAVAPLVQNLADKVEDIVLPQRG